MKRALLLLALTLSGCGSSEQPRPTASSVPVQVEARPLPPELAPPGDPANGRRLYELHCAACHGNTGTGDGPAAAYLYPAPRNHTDPNAMNRRSSADLYQIIAGGGPALGLSSLMPAWSDTFGPHQMWDLVAFLQSIYQPVAILLPVGRPIWHEVILSDALFQAASEQAGGVLPANSRKVTFFSTTTGTALFGTVTIGEKRVPLGLAVDSDYHILKARTFGQVALLERGFAFRLAIDRFLEGLAGASARHLSPPQAPEEIARVVPGLSANLRQLAILLELAQEQEKQDMAQADRALAVYKAHPESLAEGERLFLLACAPCHGPTGKGMLLPGRTDGLKSRNLSDGSHMNAVSDERLHFLLANGGARARLSSAMPAFGDSFSSAQLLAIQTFVRSLARPARAVSHAP
jgi:mono/diheme cytochrome c family protein